MAVKDIRSNLMVQLAFNAVIASDTTTVGTAIIDTAEFELGCMFALATTAYAAGDFAMEIVESDADDMTGATAITGDALIDGGGADTTAASAVPTALLDNKLQTVGIFSNLRYVRVNVVSTNSADATIVVHCIQKGEYLPDVSAPLN